MRTCELTHLEIVEKHPCHFVAIFRTGCGCERHMRVDGGEIREHITLPVAPFPPLVSDFGRNPTAEAPDGSFKQRVFKLERREGRNLYYREV